MADVATLVAPLRRLRERLLARLHGDTYLLGLAVAVGLGTGLLATALIRVIELVQRLAFGTSPGPTTILLAPAVGGLVVGLLVAYLVPEAAGGGMRALLRTLALHGGRFRAVVPFGGVAASGVALGTGASGGRETPILLIGGSLGSLLGRLFAVDEDHLRTLVAAGAGAGIGASFNAPIGGMLFAIEVVLGAYRVRAMQLIVVASVVGSVTTRQLVGPEIIYAPAVQYSLGDPRELGLYALLGVLAVLAGMLFRHTERAAARAFARLELWPPLRPALGGLGVGLIALAVPEVLGTGEHLPPIPGERNPIQAMLDGGFGAGYTAVATLIVLALAKIVATGLTVGSRNAAGTFAPLIFIGAALGGAVGHLTAVLLPGSTVQPGAFALVGMAAVFGATYKAPLTAIVIAFELTGDYGLVLPLMLATGIATFITDRIYQDSLHMAELREEGVIYAEPQDIDIMQTVEVGEIMTTDPDVVPHDLPLGELRRRFLTTGHHGFPVVDGDRLVGVVTVSDLARVDRGEVPSDVPVEQLTAGDICTRRVVTVTPKDPVFRALRRMASLDVGRLPVVDPQDHSRLVGLVRRADIVKAYRRAVTRSLGVQQRRDRSRLRDLAGVHFMEFVVDPAAPAAGRAVREIRWPERTILTSIRRDGEVITPHGDTVLEAGDEVVVLTAPEVAEEVRRLIAEPAPADRSP